MVPPTRILDGFGVFGPPPPTARPVAAGFTGRATADHPPGFYGPPEGLLAVNTLAPDDRLTPLDFAPLNARRDVYRVSEPQDLRGPVMLAAMGLLALDALVVFFLAGGIAQLFRRRPRRAATAAIALAIAGATLACCRSPASAQDDAAALRATLQTRLAYVVTGNDEVDRVSQAGLQGLTLFLAQRTALEAGDPVGIDPGRDELAFYPLIYWPMVPGATRPSREALEQIDAYMKNGGTVLFDTRDAIEAAPGSGTVSPNTTALRTILSSLDIPELEPVPRDHVLTKTFYLLKEFPGRYAGGQLWVEATATERDDDTHGAPGAHRRRRLLHHHHVERSRRRLGAAAGRPGHAADGRRRAAPARIRVPRRRQHRDVHADRQLQGRSGPRAGIAGTAGAVGEFREPRHLIRPARARLRHVVGARDCGRARVLLLASRSRGAFVRVGAMALFVLALANPSLTREDRDPLTSIVVVVVDKSASQEFGDRTQADRSGARRALRAARPHPQSRSALRRGRRVAAARPTARGCSRR